MNQEFKSFVDEVCLGNKDAQNFCICYGEIIGLIDDLIDKDKECKPYDIVRAFNCFAINMACNPFWIDNSQHLLPMIINGGNTFLHAEELAKSNDVEALKNANILKSEWSNIFYMIAFLLGGQEHAVKMMAKHKTYGDYKKEFNLDNRVESVAEYYDKTTDLYLEAVGDHFQITSWHKDRDKSDRIQFERIGIKDGDVILDAGCGVFGPATNILKFYPNCKVIGITISPKQHEICKEKIANFPLDMKERCEVILGDYAKYKFADNTFDKIVFFESLCYANPEDVAYNLAPSIKKDGNVYVVGWFVPQRDLSTKDCIDIKAHNDEWKDNVKTSREVSEAFGKFGLSLTKSAGIGSMIDYENLLKAVGSRLAKWHKTTAWLDLLVMEELIFSKEFKG